MKNYLPKYIIVLMSLSILVLFFFQYLILNRSIKQSQLQFNMSMGSILKDISKDLNNDITRVFKNPPIQIKDIDYVSIELHGDSAKLFYHQLPQNNDIVVTLLSKEIEAIVNPNLDSDVAKRLEENFVPHKYEHDGKEKIRIYEFISLMNIKQNLVSNKLTEIFNNTIWDRYILNEIHSQKLNNEYVNSIIKKHLNLNGLILDFGYTIGVGEKNYTMYNLAHEQITSTNYETQLFSIPGYSSEIILKVIFPNKASYLIKSNLVIIIISVVFSLFILITFLFSIKSINAQKKIAEFKNDFLRKMSHDFKTPIATMGLALDSLTNEQLINKPDQIRLFSGVLKEEINRLHVLLEKILEASMLQKGDVELKLKKTNISSLLSGIVHNLELHAVNKNGKINLSKPDNDINLFIDQNLFTHVINNLVDNGIKYNLRKPEIDINLNSNAEKLYIHIKDNGIGIPEEEQNKVFDKLYRIENKNLGEIEGTGLGLYFVKKSIELMNGKIQLSSIIDEGSEFIIEFPLKTENGKD